MCNLTLPRNGSSSQAVQWRLFDSLILACFLYHAFSSAIPTLINFHRRLPSVEFCLPNAPVFSTYSSRAFQGSPGRFMNATTANFKRKSSTFWSIEGAVLLSDYTCSLGSLEAPERCQNSVILCLWRYFTDWFYAPMTFSAVLPFIIYWWRQEFGGAIWWRLCDYKT